MKYWKEKQEKIWYDKNLKKREKKTEINKRIKKEKRLRNEKKRKHVWGIEIERKRKQEKTGMGKEGKKVEERKWENNIEWLKSRKKC